MKLKALRGLALAGMMCACIVGEIQAVIVVEWAENAGDGNDVTLTVSGSYTWTGAEGSLSDVNNTSYNSRVFESSRFYIPTTSDGYDWVVDIDVVYSGILQAVTITGDLGEDFMFNTNSTNYMAVRDAGSTLAGKFSAPSGVATIQNKSFADLFGTANVSDFLRVSSGSGVPILVSVSTSPVPEPSSTALLGLGGLALMLRRRR